MSLEVTTSKPVTKQVKTLRLAGADTPSQAPKKPWRGPMIFGYSIMFLFFGVFGVWAATAPLASGVIAPGKLMVESKRKLIQSSLGGEISEILIKEGDRVKKGQVLLRFESTMILARMDITHNKINHLLANKAMMTAERDGLDELQYPDELLSLQSQPAVGQIIASTRDAFQTRRAVMQRQIELRQRQIEQSDLVLQSLDIRESAIKDQLGFIEEELADVVQMYRKGLERKARVLRLRRGQSSLQGQVGELATRRAQTYQRVASQELEIDTLRQQIRGRAVERLRSIAQRLEDDLSKLSVLEEQLRNVEVRSPRNGTVMNLAVNAIGNVVARGAIVMEIVPADDELIALVKIKDKDIDAVRIGSAVQVRVKAFNPRITPPLRGVLESVTPDLVASTGKKSYYHAVIRIDPTSIRRSLKDSPLRPGMKASAIIAVGERTLLTYWITPLKASFEMSMREP